MLAVESNDMRKADSPIAALPVHGRAAHLDTSADCEAPDRARQALLHGIDLLDQCVRPSSSLLSALTSKVPASGRLSSSSALGAPAAAGAAVYRSSACRPGC